METNVQLASRSWFLMEKVQKQVLSLKRIEVFFFIDIKHVGVKSMGST